MKKYIIGIDVGGTNTDAVIIDQEKNIIATYKTPTTTPLHLGLKIALQEICIQAKISPEQVQRILIGTTQATNALLQNSDLLKVGVIRLATDCTDGLPPFCTWPTDLANNVNAGFAIISGGYECDGREIASINPNEIEQAVKKLIAHGMQSLAIIGVFSPINPAQEEDAAQICKKILGNQFPISLSHKIGGINFLERENATIINSALKQCMKHGFESFKQMAKNLGFVCDLHLTQNNGTIISLHDAIEYPVLTISSGPTNSFVGALQLTGLSNAVIVDIGGTSTDVGIALNGFARRSLSASSIAGIPLNFTMPDIISIAIGGGSYIETHNGTITIGPKSCAKNLLKESLIFGGTRMTLTDVAVAKQFITIPQANNTQPNISDETANFVINYVENKILQLYAQIAGKHKNLPIVLIGGGAQLFQNSAFAKKVLIPKLAPIANALGAALAQISGTIDTIVPLQDRKKTLLELTKQAKQQAIKAGALADTLKVIEQQIIPYHYTSNNLTRIKITVIGNLSHES